MPQKQFLTTEGSHNSERNYELYVPAKEFIESLVKPHKNRRSFGGLPDLDSPLNEGHDNSELFNPNLSFSSRITPLSEAIKESQQNHMTFDFGNTKSPFRMVPPTFQKTSHGVSPRMSVTGKIPLATKVSLFGHPHVSPNTFHGGLVADRSVPESNLVTKESSQQLRESVARLIPDSISRAKANQRSLASRREDEWFACDENPTTSFKEFEKEITQEAKFKSPFNESQNKH